MGFVRANPLYYPASQFLNLSPQHQIPGKPDHEKKSLEVHKNGHHTPIPTAEETLPACARVSKKANSP